MADLAPKLVADMIGVNPESTGVELAIEVMSRVSSETYRKALAAIAGFDRRGALGSIPVPTLALAGEHDRTAPPALMKKMADKIPGGDYVFLGGCWSSRQSGAPNGVQRSGIGMARATVNGMRRRL